MTIMRAPSLAAGLVLAAAFAAIPHPTSGQQAQITPYESRVRHQFAQDYGIPAVYAGLRNPLPDTLETWTRGAVVYDRECASCHGLAGEGKGPRSQDLPTPPADLAWFATLPMSRWDGFMYWTIAEGGEPFGTAMPAYKKSLPEEDIWAVTAYVRRTLGDLKRS